MEHPNTSLKSEEFPGKKVESVCESPLAEANAAASNNSPIERKLTPEEQLALYEEHLKETDWGHQPC